MQSNIIITINNGYQQDNIQRFKLNEKLGHGAFASVYSALNCENNAEFAVKMFKSGANNYIYWKNETRICKLLNEKNSHENILKYYECGVHIRFNEQMFPRVHHFIMYEKMENNASSFFKKLHKNGFFTESILKNVMVCVARGLEFMHINNIIHTDVKPSNILINISDFKVCLADFGTSTVSYPLFSRCVGTDEYCAPELILGLKYSYECDIWSLALTFYKLLTNKYLFNLEESQLCNGGKNCMCIYCGIKTNNEDKDVKVSNGEMSNDEMQNDEMPNDEMSDDEMSDNNSYSSNNDNESNNSVNLNNIKMLYSIHSILGPIPPNIAKKCKFDYFNKRGQLKGRPLISNIKLKNILINDYYKYHNFIQNCLKYEPEERTNISNIINYLNNLP